MYILNPFKLQNLLKQVVCSKKCKTKLSANWNLQHLDPDWPPEGAESVHLGTSQNTFSA